MWKSLEGILVNIVPWEDPSPKTLGAYDLLKFLALELPSDNIHQYNPSDFLHIVSMLRS